MTEPDIPSATPSEIRVLLVDDSKSARRVTTAQLNSAGYEVITASDGFAALADVVAHRPHIVVADIVMPRLDGYQTCALIKHNPDYQQIPVVLVSSRDGLFDRARGRLVGADDHLAKPYTEEALLTTLKRCLGSTFLDADRLGVNHSDLNGEAAEPASSTSQDHFVSPL
jgi:twitching motility two-component system response regulator PilG